MPDSDLIVPDGPQTGPDVSPPPLGARPAELAAEPKTYNEDYVEGLKNENARWRQRVHGYEEVFGDMEDDERQAYLSYVKLTRAAQMGDEEAVEELKQAGLWVDETPAATTPDTPVQGAPEQPAYITKADLDAWAAERDSQQAAAQNVAYLQSEARKYGYEPGTPGYRAFISTANDMGQSRRLTGTSLLEAAHNEVQNWLQSVIGTLQDRKMADSRNSPVMPSSVSGAPVAPATIARDRQERLARVMERLNAG